MDEPADLIILGAGLTGLNALHAATRHMGPEARIEIIDRRSLAGGMWVDSYPHVRLHQPYRTFTVGNLPWMLEEKPGYLARGDEVAQHLQHAFRLLRGKFTIRKRFGFEYLGHREEGCVVVRARGPKGRVHELRTKRLIRAAGFDIPAMRPLALSSRAVTSTTPEALRPDVDAPVYIIGGGKTAMDTALALIQARPGVRITMFTGAGTYFMNRHRMVPPGVARFTGGHLFLDTYRRLSARFDGANAPEVAQAFRDALALELPPGGARNFVFGMMSEAEAAEIAAGVEAFVPDYLVDVVDGTTGPEARMRQGPSRQVPPGAIFVNCTGYMRQSPPDPSPYLSDSGRVFTVTQGSALYFMAGRAAYFGTHLFMQDKLRDAGLWGMDYHHLRALDPDLFFITAVTHGHLNLLLAMRALSFREFRLCGLDIDRWFPLHRRVMAYLAARWRMEAGIARRQAALRLVARTHGLRCGPLPGQGGRDRLAKAVRLL